MEIHSYPKVWNMGHPSIADLFKGPVVVQEKVDGSQFSFGVVGGQLFMRSKGAAIYVETADKLFGGAVSTVVNLFERGLLNEGHTYRGEVLAKPKHNALAYERVPKGNVILFDVDIALETRVADPGALATIADDLGLEYVPTYHVGEVATVDDLKALLDRKPVLGGSMIEGVVVKNYARYGIDGKMLMGKIVADSFREKNSESWKENNPSKANIIQFLIHQYRTEARREKALQHLRDSGELEGTPRDIGKIIKEVGVDIHDECKEEIKDALFEAFWKDIQRGITAGTAEWYKEKLAAQQPIGE